ncbi:MAG: NUDIX domain-containing protein [Treponema sp.]|nr:NUDIX domain-containing protein [Treponema sp.]
MTELFTMDLRDYNPCWERQRRPSARAIIFARMTDREAYGAEIRPLPVSPDTKIAMVWARDRGYFKFPGGGLRDGEDALCALVREAREECGLDVQPDSVRAHGVARRLQRGMGQTVFEQDNLYYFCDARRDDSGSLIFSQQNLDDYERAHGFEPRIIPIKDAVMANRGFCDNDAFVLAMVARDTRVLESLCGIPSEPSRAFARALVDIAAEKNPGPWKAHSIAVAECAEKVASALYGTAHHLEPGLAYVYGLLHDIGRQEGVTYMRHVYDGHKFLQSLGYRNAARICLTHSFNLRTIEDYIGKVDVTEQEYGELKELLAATDFDDYDRLIQLMDSVCGADGTKSLEARMGDVEARYGYYPEKKRAQNYALKSYFENLTGRDLYELISA